MNDSPTPFAFLPKDFDRREPASGASPSTPAILPKPSALPDHAPAPLVPGEMDASDGPAPFEPLSQADFESLPPPPDIDHSHLEDPTVSGLPLGSEQSGVATVNADLAPAIVDQAAPVPVSEHSGGPAIAEPVIALGMTELQIREKLEEKGFTFTAANELIASLPAEEELMRQRLAEALGKPFDDITEEDIAAHADAVGEIYSAHALTQALHLAFDVDASKLIVDTTPPLGHIDSLPVTPPEHREVDPAFGRSAPTADDMRHRTTTMPLQIPEAVAPVTAEAAMTAPSASESATGSGGQPDADPREGGSTVAPQHIQASSAPPPGASTPHAPGGINQRPARTENIEHAGQQSGQSGGPASARTPGATTSERPPPASLENVVANFVNGALSVPWNAAGAALAGVNRGLQLVRHNLSEQYAGKIRAAELGESLSEESIRTSLVEVRRNEMVKGPTRELDFLQSQVDRLDDLNRRPKDSVEAEEWSDVLRSINMAVLNAEERARMLSKRNALSNEEMQALNDIHLPRLRDLVGRLNEVAKDIDPAIAERFDKLLQAMQDAQDAIAKAFQRLMSRLGFSRTDAESGPSMEAS